MSAGRGLGGLKPGPESDFVIVQAQPGSRKKREPGDARKRRRWLLGGAVVIAALTYAGVAEARHLNPPEVPRYGVVTLPFADLANQPTVLDPSVVSCGAPAPKPRHTSGSFSLSEQAWDVTTEGTNGVISSGGTALFDGDARANVTYSARIASSDPEPTPLLVSPVAFVYVQDGVVVGWAGSRFDFGSSAFVTAMPDSARALTGPVPPADTSCVGGAPVAGSVPAGEYQVYPVVRLLASPELAAEAWLFWHGFTVPDMARDASGTPDSWDCRHPQSYDSRKVTTALCATEPIAGVSINRDAESISVPYTATYFAKNVDNTLVGDPTVVTLKAVPVPSGLTETPASASDLRCGALVANLPGDSWGPAATTPIEQSVVESFGAAEASNEEGLRLAILPATPGVTRVTYPEPLRTWIYGWNTGAQYSDSRVTILGTATATVASGAPIPLDRVAGPSVTTVTLTDVRWCDGPDGPADPASIRGLTVTAGPAEQILDRSSATSALVRGLVWAGPVTVTVDGATTTAERFGSWVAETSYFDYLTN